MSAEPEETGKATQKSVTLIPVRYHKKKDGTVFPVEITASLIELDNRKTITVSMRDITDRNRNEAEISEKNSTLSILNSVAIEQAGIKNDESLIDLIVKQLKTLTGAAASVFSEYDSQKKVLVTKKIEADQKLLKSVIKLIGNKYFKTGDTCRQRHVSGYCFFESCQGTDSG